MLRTTLLAIAATTCLALPAVAEGLTATQSVVRQVITENEDGSKATTFVDVERAAPGEELFYKLSIQNDGDTPAEGITPTMAVPAEVTYVEGSATTQDGVSVAFSADGGETFAPRGNLLVSVEGEPRRALAEEITHVRWTLSEPVAAGAESGLGFRAVLK